MGPQNVKNFKAPRGPRILTFWAMKWQLHARTDSTQIDISGEIEWKSDLTGLADIYFQPVSATCQLARLDAQLT